MESNEPQQRESLCRTALRTLRKGQLRVVTIVS